MIVVEFRGHSDDTFGYEFVGTRRGDDHDDCANGKVRAWRVLDPTGAGVLVVGAYNKVLPGVWFVGIAPLDEDVPLPQWAMDGKWRAENYTTVLRLELPDGSTIKLDSVDGDPIKPDKDDD